MVNKDEYWYITFELVMIEYFTVVHNRMHLNNALYVLVAD